MESNIRLVVSDVDSTLLMPGEECLDKRFFETVKKLKNKGSTTVPVQREVRTGNVCMKDRFPLKMKIHCAA